MRLFVIGATGYIGRDLFARAKKSGEAFGTSSSDRGGLLSLRLDESNSFDYDQICCGDVILLTAAISAPDTCAREREQAWAVNVDGTSHFIQRAIDRGARVIFFSSDAVYGEREKEFAETMECNPAGDYAGMKFEVERRFLSSLSFKAVRLSYVFSREDKFSNYLSKCIEQNKEADLFHPFFRAIVHRDDVIEGVLALATKWDDVSEKIINFGGPQILSRIDFAECLRESHFYNLRFKVTEPDASFFANRPRIIAMKSPIFQKILGRLPRTLHEAVRLEFASSISKDSHE